MFTCHTPPLLFATPLRLPPLRCFRLIFAAYISLFAHAMLPLAYAMAL